MERETGKVSFNKLGSGPALVLIHGFPQTGSIWMPIAEALAGNYTVYMPDMPGCGGSHLGGKMGLDKMGEAVYQMLREEGLGEVVVAGHSMGGYIALAIAEGFPGIVKGLSLIHSTPFADDDAKIEMRNKAISIIKNGGKDVFLKQMINNLFAQQFKNEHQEQIDANIESSKAISSDALVNFYEAMIQRPDRSSVVSKSVFPIQWIFGSEDNIMPYQKLLQYSHQSYVNFVTVYQQCGHMSMLEDPEKLKMDLKVFLDYCYNKT